MGSGWSQAANEALSRTQTERPDTSEPLSLLIGKCSVLLAVATVAYRRCTSRTIGMRVGNGNFSNRTERVWQVDQRRRRHIHGDIEGVTVAPRLGHCKHRNGFAVDEGQGLIVSGHEALGCVGEPLDVHSSSDGRFRTPRCTAIVRGDVALFKLTSGDPASAIGVEVVGESQMGVAARCARRIWDSPTTSTPIAL